MPLLAAAAVVAGMTEAPLGWVPTLQAAAGIELLGWRAAERIATMKASAEVGIR